MKQKFQFPGPEHDQLFQTEYDHKSGAKNCDSCDKKYLVIREPRQAGPVIHYGLIGSANPGRRFDEKKELFALRWRLPDLWMLFHALLYGGFVTTLTLIRINTGSHMPPQRLLPMLRSFLELFLRIRSHRQWRRPISCKHCVS
jgi:hypothetical protein